MSRITDKICMNDPIHIGIRLIGPSKCIVSLHSLHYGLDKKIISVDVLGGLYFLFTDLFFQICIEGCQVALDEILEILTVVCEEHKLPLA
jgi:hypothetical protein